MMNCKKKKLLVRVLVCIAILKLVTTFASDAKEGKLDNSQNSYKRYRKAVLNTQRMINNSSAQKLVQEKGLHLINLTWEDTGRYKNSSVGPNISDMTIQVGLTKPGSDSFETFLMPIIRLPNCSDLTTDLDPQAITLLVGNQKAEALKRVSLYNVLKYPLDYLNKPDSWSGFGKKSLLADRDSKVLVSAQACFLPVPKKGKATFNPVLFNYQSYEGDPAVLTILATREGTSMTIIDNKRDAFASGALWGQRLFFNRNGERASLTGERISDFITTGSKTVLNSTKAPEIGRQSGLNMVMLIQVPLKQKSPMRFNEIMDCESSASPVKMEKKMRANSDVESAVIGSGEIEGSFTEIANLNIERDTRFPVRVTVQFYLATSTGKVTAGDIDKIHKQIHRVYEQGDYISSLVTGGENTGRITEYMGAKVQPASWWQSFWNRYEKNMGIRRYQAIDKMKRKLGIYYHYYPVSELYLQDILKQK